MISDYTLALKIIKSVSNSEPVLILPKEELYLSAIYDLTSDTFTVSLHQGSYNLLMNAAVGSSIKDVVATTKMEILAILYG